MGRWHHRDAQGGLTEVAVQGPLSSTSGDVPRQWALAGEGLSLEAAWDVSGDLQGGRLVTCLPQITWQEVTLYATFLPGRPVPARVRMVVDWLARLVASCVPPAGSLCLPLSPAPPLPAGT